jgi:hypothetical protein
LTTFPDVLLELPNLAWLSLAGDRLGDLPDPITRRAEAGTLELWYRPHAVAFDAASVLVIVTTVVLPLLSAWGVHRGWAARERTAREAARRQGTVFPIPPLFRRPMLFVLFAVVAVCLVVVVAALSGTESGITMEASVMLVMVLSPLVVVALYLLARHTGMVVLTRSGVSLRRLGRERFLPYDRVVELRSQPRIGGPALVVRGSDRTIRIPRAVEDRPRLYQQLRRRVPAAARDAALREPASAPGPVYAFEVDRRVWALYVAGTVLLVLAYLGIGLSGLWVGWARGTVPPFTWARLRGPGMLFALTSLLFVPAILLVVRGLRTHVGPFGVEQPVALQLFRDRLRYRFPRRPLGRASRRGDVWHERPARDLQHAALEPVPFSAQARVAGALASRRTTRYVVRLTFEDGAQWVVGQERAAQWGQTPEQLHAIIEQLYG